MSPYREPGNAAPPTDAVEDFLSAAREYDRCADVVKAARGPQGAAEIRLAAAFDALPESVREMLETHAYRKIASRIPGVLR